MNKTYIFLLFVLFHNAFSWGQKYRNLDFFSASGHLGINILPRPKNPEFATNSPGFNFSGNFAYKIDYLWGVRADVGFNLFKANESPNVKSLSLGVAAFMDILQYGTEGYVERNGEFSILAYSGFGLASAWEKRRLSGDTKFISGNDDMLYWNLGVMPRIRLAKDITLNGDFGYTLYLFKDRYFDGTGVMPKEGAGGKFTLSFGITYEIK
jgi:hypothetical protein